ncbi:hypothetical protein [Qipengyuania gaetbuli]|uniref:hypothetical protein n=1 Tax=Qipengyuania gaetbuli TaxID=266952 RepID=UPI001CD3CBA7|nr:hypothetical protein [Qipengyuania gaetbuli]MCA0910476.1 hypothetical protein [Qipengyuania gaetbuli]
MTDYFLLAFWLFLLGALTISWRAGDRRDRVMIALIVATAIASSLTFSFLAAGQALAVVVVIDCILLAAIGRFALSGDKYWPLWFAAFHAATVTFEGIALFLPPEASMVFWRVGAFWSLPALLAMTTGLILDQYFARNANGDAVVQSAGSAGM